jgi:hypothetical protein
MNKLKNKQISSSTQKAKSIKSCKSLKRFFLTGRFKKFERRLMNQLTKTKAA